MFEFDMLEDAEEFLQPLCLCINQDYSRVGVGHQNGYVIYRIDRCRKCASSLASGAESCGKNETASAPSNEPPFFTTVEAVFPPKQNSNTSTPTKWEVPRATIRAQTAPLIQKVGKMSKRRFEDNDNIEKNSQWSSFVEDTQLQELRSDKDNSKNVMDVSKKAEERQSDEGCKNDDSNDKPLAKPQWDKKEMQTMSPDIALKDNIDMLYPEPCRINTKPPMSSAQLSASGVGVMALLYKTRFVAAVGGGPNPIGEKNIVHLFVTGSRWPERSMRVPDPVKALRLDHCLIIILTAAELRLQSLETEQCFFVLPLLNNDAQLLTIPQSPSIALVETYSLISCSLNQSDHKPCTENEKILGSSKTAINEEEKRVGMCYDVPFAIDYSKKCFAFCNSMYGFSFLHYDTESSFCKHAVVKVLATVPNAHQHPLASLALHLVGDAGNTRTNNTFAEHRRWNVATSSQQATLIRIWRYYDNTEDSTASGEVAVSALQPHNYDAAKNDDSLYGVNDKPLGYFVMVKVVRNESLPAPIFQMQFIGESFLCCVSQNTLKIFFVGEREKSKPCDISTKDPNKIIHAQNNRSSLRRFGLVSAYFLSEWAACTCPLPLKDSVFLPKWVNTTFGALRRHLLRGIELCDQKNDGFIAAGDESPMRLPSSTHFSAHGSKKNMSKTTSSSTNLSLGVCSLFRRCASMQVTPLFENFNWVTKRYWGDNKSNNNNENNDGHYYYYGENSSKNDLGSHVDGKMPIVDPLQGVDSAMTDIAQSFVMWWEQPENRQSTYISNALLHSAAVNSTETVYDSCLSHKSHFSVKNLYCVTCDGSALMFTFDPVEGKVVCGAAVAASFLR